VLDEFEFHLSLTHKLDGMSIDMRTAWQQAAQIHFAPLGACRFDRLALFIEPQRGADFVLFDHVVLHP
jgi:hypothetical protein